MLEWEVEDGVVQDETLSEQRHFLKLSEYAEYMICHLFPKGVLGWVCQLIGEDQEGQVVTDAFLSQIRIST